MATLRESLQEAESVDTCGMPGLSEWYDQLGQDVRQYADNMWPDVTHWAQMQWALRMASETWWLSSQIEIKLYLALMRRYIREMTNYPKDACLLPNKRLSALSEFLAEKGHKRFFGRGDVDYEIDIFLYLDCSLANVPGKGLIRYPFWVAVDCDGHEFHERTKWQAMKDRRKDRALMRSGLKFVRFTGAEITLNADQCVMQIEQLRNTHILEFERLARLATGAEP